MQKRNFGYHLKLEILQESHNSLQKTESISRKKGDEEKEGDERKKEKGKKEKGKEEREKKNMIENIILSVRPFKSIKSVFWFQKIMNVVMVMTYLFSPLLLLIHSFSFSSLSSYQIDIAFSLFPRSVPILSKKKKKKPERVISGDTPLTNNQTKLPLPSQENENQMSKNFLLLFLLPSLLCFCFCFSFGPHTNQDTFGKSFSFLLRNSFVSFVLIAKPWTHLRKTWLTMKELEKKKE